MNNFSFEDKRWQLFLQICDKQNLDLKGENIKDYKSNFDGAFRKAHNIAMYFITMALHEDYGKDKGND